MAVITTGFIRSLSTAVSTAFNVAYDAAPSVWERFSMTVPSTGSETTYPKLDQLRGMRLWTGDRVIQDLAASTYTIENFTFEQTVAIPRERMEDDNYGIYMPVAGELGTRSKSVPDELIANIMNNGQALKCSDGQNFFDVDHLNYKASGGLGLAVTPTTVVNYQAGTVAGAPAWYLFDTSRALKPLIFQTRRPFRLTPMTELTTQQVFFENRLVWGVDGRCNAGFGMWQLAYKSTAPLTSANYALARATMASITRPDGAPMGITPTLLVTGPSLEATARKLLLGDYDIDSTAVISSNPWKGSAEYVKDTWIA